MRISVVIVSRNRASLLRESLALLGTNHQIIVVDNASEGGLNGFEDEFLHARFIRLPKNFGLTKALNIGLRGAEGEFVLFLHDDTLIHGEGASQLADVLEANPQVGAVAPLLVNRLGHPVPQVRLHPPGSDLTVVPEGGDADVPSVSGAALMIRTFFLKAMRQIDEHYGNFGSDLDLCAQVHQRANRKVRVVQSVRAVHEAAPVHSTLSAADTAIGTAVYLAKYQGAMAGWKHRFSTAAGAIVSFRWAMAKHLLSNQKIDGTQ